MSSSDCSQQILFQIQIKKYQSNSIFTRISVINPGSTIILTNVIELILWIDDALSLEVATTPTKT